ncbi:MAG: virulence-associated protein E [Clostridia bacterium]|nr:virulence-associated protein E [Clostridia bacterium]
MNYDRKLTICTAGNRDALFWAPAEMQWGELVARLKTPQKGTETHDAYLRMPKPQQDKLKDVGGFLGGTLRGGRRKIANVAGRDLITLDLDAIPADGTEGVLFDVDLLGCAACVYSTRKHDPDHPRLRVILPLTRTATAEEYEPLARKVAEKLGLEKADPTCFRPNQMMYWPNVSMDSEYIYEVYDKPLLDPDAVLGEYRDWRDARQWPQLAGAKVETRPKGARQQDPLEKNGVVGAFCRCYSITRAMDELLPGVYTPNDDPERFTYTNGSTAGGAIVYEDKWLYSHHATDPCSGTLCNAWDMVRLHKFGDRDEKAAENTPANRLPSFGAMQDYALTLEGVRLDLIRQKTSPEEDFGGPVEDDRWEVKLAVDRNGNARLTAGNLALIFHNDPALKDKFGYNAFRYAVTAEGPLPWNTRDRCPRDWTDADDASLRNFFDIRYGLTGSGKISDMFTQIAHERITDDVRDYLDGLEWDGVPRVDTLLARYLKADDTPYTRVVTRKTLVAAVARTMDPGCKFDSVLTLIGAQGIAKSMFVDILGGRWYNDSIQSFNGKEAQEQLRGSWLVEIPEVDRFSTKFDSAIIKQFITRRDDVFRESYGHRTASHPRRCVFIATTNNPEFLVDATGNRRWWVVQCHATADDRGEDMASLRRDRDQVWAEAVAIWRTDEPLELDGSLAADALRQQENAQAEDSWRGMIAEWLERRIPDDWSRRDLETRKLWWSDEFGRLSDAQLVPRQTVCVAEIWCELMGKDKSDLDIVKSRRITNTLRALGEWEMVGTRPTAAYGNQKTFRRKDGG